ncbi:unnamed protein product [Diplocarpon coronariae]
MVRSSSEAVESSDKVSIATALALTAALSSRVPCRPAIAELKPRWKSKPKSKSKTQKQPVGEIFTPVEYMGSSLKANVALSMHSEMIATRSALSLSGAQAYPTSARSAKLKHEASTPTPELAARRPLPQVLATAPAASPAFKSRVLTPGLLKQANPYEDDMSIDKEEEKESPNVNPNENVAANRWKSADKHQANKKSSSSYEDGYPCEGHDHHKASQKNYPRKCGSGPPRFSSKSRGNISTAASQTSSIAEDDISSQKIKSKVFPSPSHVGGAADIFGCRIKPQLSLDLRRSSPPKTHLPANPTPQHKPETPRLKGSGLYVARRGSSNRTPASDAQAQTKSRLPTHPPPRHPQCLTTASRSSPGPKIRASRPCYRRVTAMPSVATKRVFWTTQRGEWEGSKVRDLVDALEVRIGGGCRWARAGNRTEGQGRPWVSSQFVVLRRCLMGSMILVELETVYSRPPPSYNCAVRFEISLLALVIPAVTLA